MDYEKKDRWDELHTKHRVFRSQDPFVVRGLCVCAEYKQHVAVNCTSLTRPQTDYISSTERVNKKNSSHGIAIMGR